MIEAQKERFSVLLSACLWAFFFASLFFEKIYIFNVDHFKSLY